MVQVGFGGVSVLLGVLFISVDPSGGRSFVGNPLARAHPCNGTDAVVEEFESNQPPEDENKYVLSILLKNLKYPGPLTINSKIRITMDSEANITLSSPYGRIRSHEPGKFVIYAHTRVEGYVGMTVRGRQGKPVPNLLSLELDGDDLCPDGVQLGIWDNYIKGTEDSAVTVLKAPMSDRKCGRRMVEHTELITNSLPSKPGDWPWHSALYRTTSASSAQIYICGGSLVSPTRIVTAGHCVIESGRKISSERLFAVLGKYNLAGGDIESQEKSVFEILLHPQFNSTFLRNDIAILKLSSEVVYGQYVQPICLWDRSKTEKSTVVSKAGTVVGWGFNEGDAISHQLMTASMPVVADLECIRSYPSFFEKFLDDTTFCAGFRNGTAVCNGDSGGGMYFPEKDVDDKDSWFLRGVVSVSVSRTDRKLCDPNHFTVFTDSAKYLDWIENNIK